MKSLGIIEDIKSIFRPLWVWIVDPFKEIFIGFVENSIPFVRASLLGVTVSLFHYFGGINKLLALKHWRIPIRPELDSWFGVSLCFCGFYFWGLLQIYRRNKLQRKLNEVFINADLKTKIGLFPTFVHDCPIGSYSRQLRVKAHGIPVEQFKERFSYLNAGLNVNVYSVENPKGNKEFVDINYSLEKMPEFWKLEDFIKYKDFSFPIGRTLDGEIRTNLRKIPHFLVAGETNSGKSTFIRTMVTVLIQNNPDMEIYYVDMKGKMDAQSFVGFRSIQTLGEIGQILSKFTHLNKILDKRMDQAEKLQAKNIDEYNLKQKDRHERWNRILVVVDEIAELMPTFNSNDREERSKSQAILNRFSRLGRAVGLHLVIGVQKPDHKNLDPTIKANLPGIVCFPVSHFSQSTLILGNGHAAELNASIPGRGIWKHGSYEIEIQAPFLSDDELSAASNANANYFKQSALRKSEATVEEKKDETISTAFSAPT